MHLNQYVIYAPKKNHTQTISVPSMRIIIALIQLVQASIDSIKICMCILHA